MSGGHFEYKEYYIKDISDELLKQSYIFTDTNVDTDLLKNMFQYISADLNVLFRIVKHLDYYLSADYSFDSLIEHLIEEDMGVKYWLYLSNLFHSLGLEKEQEKIDKKIVELFKEVK
jgi:hypothetical protein